MQKFQIKKYLEPRKIQNVIENFSQKVYRHLIEYYGIMEEVDEKMYKWITDGKSDLFGFTYDSYLIATGDIDGLLKINENIDQDYINKIINEIDLKMIDFQN